MEAKQGLTNIGDVLTVTPGWGKLRLRGEMLSDYERETILLRDVSIVYILYVIDYTLFVVFCQGQLGASSL